VNPSGKTRDVREVMRDEMVMRDRIVALMKDGPKTVPEVAQALDVPDHEAMYWIMAMRRYGLLVEVGRPNEFGYFCYKVVEKSP
jgi:predicted transcriptional regulator